METVLTECKVHLCIFNYEPECNVINPIAEYFTFSWVSNMEGDFNESARREPPIPKSNIFMNGFSTYCQQTSLHGWQYVDSENGLCRKIIWFLMMLVFSAASIGKL